MFYLTLLLSIQFLVGWANDTNSIHPTIQNTSHQIYSFPNLNRSNSANIADCDTANCVIQCMEHNSCEDLTINAVQVDNVQILCASYNSCVNIKLNAMNQTKVNMNCFYAHSCTHSTIFLFDSHLKLLCNREDSCKNTKIWIHKPLQNALDISCTAETSCENVEIEPINKILFMWSDINWLNISRFTEQTNILLRCRDDNADDAKLQIANLVYSDDEERMQCSHDTICCPVNYQSGDTNDTAFYSTLETNDNELSDLFLFQYFSGYLAPLLCISLLYTICVCCWATIYFCCNTLSAYRKYKSFGYSNTKYFAKYPMTSVCEGSSCWNKCGYFVDGFSIVTDFLLFTSILLYSPMANHKQMWLIAGYLSVVASLFGILFFFSKLKILTIFYPPIALWRKELERHYNDIDHKLKQKVTISERRKAMKWNVIKHKTHKISLFLKYIVMYDLFSASLQDSLQSVVILSVFMNYQMSDEEEEYDEMILDTEYRRWTIFEWILRIKLAMCLLFMIYKLINGMSVESKCHSERIRNERDIKPHHTVYIDIEDDTTDINEYGHYHSVYDDTDNDSDERNGFTANGTSTKHKRKVIKMEETKYEEEPDELKQFILPKRQWSNVSTGAVTMNITENISEVHDDKSPLTVNVEQNAAQFEHIEMAPKQSEIVETDAMDEKDEEAKDGKETELQHYNGILPNIITRKRPLSISRSGISSKSEKIQQHHVMSENHSNHEDHDAQGAKHVHFISVMQVENENEDSCDYDTDPVSIHTELIHN